MLRRGTPPFPVLCWWDTQDLCEVERVYFDAIRTSPSVLDVGAGDLRIMKKFQRAGYRGAYHTQDVGGEAAYTFRDLDEAPGRYGAILCLDVIEHLPLREGLALITKMVSLLETGGALVLQTPNATYIPDPRSWDMSHVQTYNAGDLWAFLTCEGLETSVYRVVLRERNPGPILAAKLAITAYVKRKVLGCDYAANLAAIARKRV